ncbi:alpha-(1,3)-fucosyltransferase 7 [Chanos chanos]|uniref:Fucosyltransferase n=1 Tax=Chanos chanos TaxID=29144 RepID=A0A6J2UUS5_CHACN|nr:alpha-(1,3)-fucosyltransferase 7-like [Chanos chanos]
MARWSQKNGFCSNPINQAYHNRNRNATKNITVLFWHWPYGQSYSLEGDVCWEKYGISHCQLVDNRSLYNNSDFVVFHHHELKLRREKLPTHLPRPPTQRWIWLSLEAPENCGDLRPLGGYFNLKMSYRRDADITIPYGKVIERGEDPIDFSIPKNKSILACWVVSNYQYQHKRTAVYEKLKKVIPVTVYGHAMRKPLTKSSLIPTISKCYFYLAFENTESADYITEKLWRNSFQAGAVPVVLGPPPSHYEAVAPPHSFIHVDTFSSVETLGKFLENLAKDKENYESYFEWHKNYKVKLYTDWRERLCTICTVYDRLPQNKVYQTLT